MKANLQGLIGIPFKKNGDSTIGINCYNLAKKVFERYNISIPDYALSVRSAIHCDLASDTINKEIDAHRAEWIKIEKPVEPCLVVLKSDIDNPDMCTHIGVYIGERKFIHIMKKINSCIQTVDNPIWTMRIDGYYLYNG